MVWVLDGVDPTWSKWRSRGRRDVQLCCRSSASWRLIVDWIGFSFAGGVALHWGGHSSSGVVVGAYPWCIGNWVGKVGGKDGEISIPSFALCVAVQMWAWCSETC